MFSLSGPVLNAVILERPNMSFPFFGFITIQNSELKDFVYLNMLILNGYAAIHIFHFCDVNQGLNKFFCII